MLSDESKTKKSLRGERTLSVSICPLDGKPAIVTDYPLTESLHVRCDECTTFLIMTAVLPLLEEHPDLKSGLSRWVRCHFEKYGSPFQITEERLGYPQDC